MDYKCDICGFIYDENKEAVKFEDLPADWVCPICGTGKNSFSEVKYASYYFYTLFLQSPVSKNSFIFSHVSNAILFRASFVKNA